MSLPSASSPVSSPSPARARPVATTGPPPIAPWFPLALVSGVVAAFSFFIVYPYLVGQSQQSADSGISWLQAEGSGLRATLLRIGALPTVFIGPVVVLLTTVWAATWAFLDWEQLRSRDRVVLLVAAVGGAAFLAFLFSPVGQDVNSWWTD